MASRRGCGACARGGVSVCVGLRRRLRVTRALPQATGIVISGTNIQGHVPTSVLIGVYLPSSASVQVFESLLVYTSNEFDVSWLRLPMCARVHARMHAAAAAATRSRMM